MILSVCILYLGNGVGVAVTVRPEGLSRLYLPEVEEIDRYTFTRGAEVTVVAQLAKRAVGREQCQGGGGGGGAGIERSETKTQRLQSSSTLVCRVQCCIVL